MPRFLVMVLLVVACDQSEGSSNPSAGSDTAVAVAPGKAPGGGFSADLAAKLETAGSGVDTPARTTTGTAPGSAAESGSAGSGSQVTTGSADAKPVNDKPTDAGSGDSKVAAGSANPVDVTKVAVGSAKPIDVKPVDVKPVDVKPIDVKPVDVKPVEPAKAGSGDKVLIGTGTTVRSPVTVPAELREIKLSLLPNWERDVEAAGTFSLAVKVPGRGETATFVFHYGYEPSTAPLDRDAYKKWLADQKILTSKDDRQKGGGWYLEGVDGTGKQAFRFVVTYGGRKLVCYGSLYRDGTAGGLGDLRDQTIIQAKQICETVTL